MFKPDLVDRAAALLALCKAKSLRVTAAESCTGGLLSALLTENAGSSAVFERGFVTYSNAAKNDLLGIPEALIATHGAVSEETARAMASGALANSAAHISVAITGIAGPDGGSPGKPVGLVHIASAHRGGRNLHERCVFTGDRRQIRLEAVKQAMSLLEDQATFLS